MISTIRKRVSPVKSKLPEVGISIFSQMTALANEHGAINLSQGFPEFDAPDYLKSQLNQYVHAGQNQYAPSAGIPNLQAQVAALIARRYQVNVSGQEQVTVTSGRLRHCLWLFRLLYQKEMKSSYLTQLMTLMSLR